MNQSILMQKTLYLFLLYAQITIYFVFLFFMGLEKKKIIKKIDAREDLKKKKY